MKRLVVVIACFTFCSCLQAQGVTLLYKNNLGWYDPLSWVQINTPAGQTPLQRVPTAEDDVVISSSMSGLSSVGFDTDNTNPDFNIGGSSLDGPARCRSMHISNTIFSIANSSLADRAPVVNIYTSKGGFVIVDSGSNMRHGIFHLNGGNPKITDLQILHSTYGILFSHAIWSGITWNSGARLTTLGSNMGGFYFGGEPGGNIFIDSSTIETNRFRLGDNSTFTLLNSKITNNGLNSYLEFFVGKNSNFVSANDTVLTFGSLKFTTSGLQFNGDVGGTGYGSGMIEFLQADPANPLPNIINGNLSANLLGRFAISGDLKISGNFFGYTEEMINNPIAVVVNNQEVFTVGGIRNYGSSAFIDDCVEDFCHFKLEFFGSTNSNITYNGGFPIDTLIINKTNCAKVTCDSSLYVSGATRIEGGQLRLDPDDNIPYKFVCAGNVDIATGAGLFLQKDSKGNVANMAVAGVITDHNPTPDSLCIGVSNPYKGLITYYRNSPLPLTLLDFYGKYYNNSIALGWSTEREINTKHFIVEKSADQLLFYPIATIHSSANRPGKKDYGFTDNTSLKPMNFYRLKMVDADGRFTYSKIVAIAVPVSNSITLFPNPVNDRLLITTAKFATVTEVIIADAKGTRIKRIQLPVGTTNAYVNTADLPAGVYSISFLSKNGTHTQQFMKL